MGGAYFKTCAHGCAYIFFSQLARLVLEHSFSRFFFPFFLPCTRICHGIALNNLNLDKAGLTFLFFPPLGSPEGVPFNVLHYLIPPHTAVHKPKISRKF